ncbi:ABC transporter permease [Larkinella insperata]|uniref:ABC transporter permease n=1 Tax=Larkinella insperata TaxID=332158 RepID=A0ABW3QGE1_9BACT|nr:ABC transporter permease [Larkinella insperata]
MLTNYLKIAWRNLLRNWGFSAINVLGLTVGVTACLLISLYVRHELSYDQFHAKANRIYRLVTDIKTPTETINTESTSFAMANAVKTGLPEVEQAVRLLNRGMLVQRGEHKFQEDGLVFADSAFFQVFSFPLLKGNPQTALVAPFSIVLTEKAALKYFGNEDPIGKALMLDGRNSATVTGVVADVPDNSQIKFDLLASMSTMTKAFAPGLDDQWGNFGPITYLLLRDRTTSAAVTARMPDLVQRQAGSFMEKNKMYYSLFLEPLTDVYLRSTRQTQESGSITNIYVFSIVAGFILLIACINFMNLVIARSSERAKEVGVRKVVGAVRSQLTGQFLSESVLLSLIAFVLAGILCELLLPAFNMLSGKIISHSLFTDGTYWLTLLGLAALVGGFAGIYPALVLSSFKPIAVLKGRFVSSSQGILLRRTLVVVQFMISVALTIGTLVAYRQLNFMRNQQLGFQKDQTLVVSLPDRDFMTKNQRSLRNQLAALPGVQAVAVSSHLPGGGSLGAYTEIENKTGEMQAANMGLYSVDFDFLPQYGVKLVAGRIFSPEFSTDSTQALVINEAAARALGYASPAQIVGKRFAQWGRTGRIIGVVKDFHTSSLREKIGPLTLRIEPGDFSLFSLKVKGADATATIQKLERFWKTAVPQRPFEYYFLDQAFDKQYRAEERFGRLFLYFSGLAIFIACLGLFGLTSYTTAQRTKEIGVRKVLGASVPNIVLLLSKDFLKLVLIAVILAAPVAWWAMDTWLQDFAYRINVEWWILVLAGVLAVTIAFLTVSFQSIKAALTNPVKSLRTE